MVDAAPRFHLDALRWFASLTRVAGVAATDLVVHVVGGGGSDVLDHLGGEGVAIQAVDRFDDRSPHCNKISGALKLAEEPIAGMVVLCDTDVAVLEDPRALAVPANSIAGKPVDAPVPSLDTLTAIFETAGLEVPATIPLSWGHDQWTVSGNNNGGLYLLPGDLLFRVVPAWAQWARWLLDRRQLLGEWAVYVDQVAMALGLASERIGSLPLDVRWNTPTHDRTRIPGDAPEPAILHYHQEVDDRGLIRSTGTASIDRSIAAVNAAVTAVWRQASPTASHRQWLWGREQEQEQGDGEAPVGSPAAGAVRHPDLAALVEALRPASVLEVGLPGGESTAGQYPGATYVGMDTSPDTVARAGQRCPEATFMVGTLEEQPLEADLVLWADPRLDRGDAHPDRDLLERLWHSTRRALVVSVPVGPAGDDRTGYVATLAAVAAAIPGAEVYPLRDDVSGVATLVAVRPPAQRHPRDYRSPTLAPLIDRHPDPAALLTLRLHAWGTLGFYPDHAPRLWEYPVVAGLVREHLSPGSRLIDIGAGVTPLAPFLTAQGYVVDTVDPSEIRRTWPPQPDWNEWDYLDYAKAGLAHRSWNCTLGEVPRQVPYDGAYSVSVIEHLYAEERRTLLADMASRVREGGLVVLTIDLVRDSNNLWNRNRGIEVEDSGVHGTFESIVTECVAVGLELFGQSTVRRWGDVEVDIGMLALRRSGSPSPSGWRGVRQRIAERVGRSRR